MYKTDRLHLLTIECGTTANWKEKTQEQAKDMNM